ncbi:hypothetical protein PAXRUDRAFT_827446 [Paxillus rubicundulus Ve08.2h10]|uniref:Uncharacterized protein n=1 Tax=Paxillus rubicundulus Ve08.2h10 TaxID=930991 RepID=A0A0D0DXY3_9AGAM|nr:hypothetical protein PAXRUDRAFT_827446 [Paxillus rubicundulus Ve08.2h10]
MAALQYVPYAVGHSPDGVSVPCEALRCRHVDMILLNEASKSEGGYSIPLQEDQEKAALFTLPVMCTFRRPLALAIRSLERVSEPSRGIEARARKDVGRWKKWCCVKDVPRYKTLR